MFYGAWLEAVDLGAYNNNLRVFENFIIARNFYYVFPYWKYFSNCYISLVNPGIDFRLDVIDIRTIFVLSDIYVAEKENSIIVTIGIM